MATELEPSVIHLLRSYQAKGLITAYSLFLGYDFPPHLIPVVYALCDERIQNLAVIIGPGSSKSSLISIVYPAWKLGHKPYTTFLNISASEKLIYDFIKASGNIIEWSPYYKAAFPNVKPDKDKGWSPMNGLFVTGHPIGKSDPSYVGSGLGSQVLTGRHAKEIILDDIHSSENSATEDQIDKVVNLYVSQILGRADPSGCRFIVCGRRWDKNDLYGTLENLGDYVFMTLPAERRGTTKRYWDIVIPDGLECCFNDGSINLNLSI